MNEAWLLCNSWKILREGGHYFKLSIVHSLIILSYIADQMSLFWPVLVVFLKILLSWTLNANAEPYIFFFSI